MSHEPEPSKEDKAEPSKDDEDFFSLLEEIKAGKQDIEVLLENPVVGQRLRTICWTFTQNLADTDDLINALLTIIWQKLGQFKPESGKPYGNFFAWVRRIAQNLVISGFRRKSLTYSDTRPEELVDLLDDRTNIASEYERRATLERFMSVAAEFGQTALMIIDYRMQDYSLREIEEKLAEAGIKTTHVSVGTLISNIVQEFLKREEDLLTTTVLRKGEQRSGLRDKPDSPSKRKRKIGS